MMQHNWVQTIYHHKLLVNYFDRTTFFYPLEVTNNMTMANAPSADDLQAAFTFLRFDPIVGEPSYEDTFQIGNSGNTQRRNSCKPPSSTTYKPIWHRRTACGLHITGRITFPTAAISWRRSTFSFRSNTRATPEHPSCI